jgi:N-acetylneuraminic acid mutarotase
MAVLSEPVVLLMSAVSPMAVLSEPLVLLISAEYPRAVFREGRSQFCGHCALLAGDCAKQARTIGSRRNARNDQPFIEVVNERVIVFINESYEITSVVCETKKPQFSQPFTERRATPSRDEAPEQHIGEACFGGLIDLCERGRERRETQQPSERHFRLDRVDLFAPTHSSMHKKSVSRSTMFSPRAVGAVVLCAAVYSVFTATVLGFFLPEATSKISQRTLTLAERVSYQRAIEDVYWRHRIWPKERPAPKPSLDAVMSQAQLEKKVEEYLRNSQAIEGYWQRPLTAENLQAEMDRMAKNTKQPEVLRELFEALDNDPFLIAECLARPVLSERLITSFPQEQPKSRLASSEVGANSQVPKTLLANTIYTVPQISYATTGCTPDTWANTSTINAPQARIFHTAVWTGSEMIVWGGYQAFPTDLNTGARYSPSTDSWTATTTTNAPAARYGHTAVWTGSEMIVWGGNDENFVSLNTGGRYNPRIDSWTPTSTTNAPDARDGHTAVWTGSEMIVWGGIGGVVRAILRTGGRYNPSTDTWTATNTHNAPQARVFQTAVWTGSEMIVWGGSPDAFDLVLRTGGIYNPVTDSWTTTNTHHAPDGRERHTAVWTGGEMIVWGGTSLSYPHGYRHFNTGGRYNPRTDRWIATSATNAPEARYLHTAVWTSSEMIVWGGEPIGGPVNTGGRYCAQAGAPTPTPAPRP